MRYVKVLTELPWPPERWWQRLVRKILCTVIPLANPDFEHLYPSVRFWLLEINADDTPQREVGFDASGRPVVIGPFASNYGFWTDPGEPIANLGLVLHEATAEEFNDAWSVVADTSTGDSPAS